MEFTENEKKILEIVFKIAYSQLDILNDCGCEIANWSSVDYNRNSVYMLSDKIGLDI